MEQEKILGILYDLLCAAVEKTRSESVNYRLYRQLEAVEDERSRLAGERIQKSMSKTMDC